MWSFPSLECWIGSLGAHDDVIKWKHFPRYWPFVRGIHRSPMTSPHKGQWRGALMFSLIYARVKRLSKQSRGWWFETPSLSLWRHCNVIGCYGYVITISSAATSDDKVGVMTTLRFIVCIYIYIYKYIFQIRFFYNIVYLKLSPITPPLPLLGAGMLNIYNNVSKSRIWYNFRRGARPVRPL